MNKGFDLNGAVAIVTDGNAAQDSVWRAGWRRRRQHRVYGSQV